MLNSILIYVKEWLNIIWEFFRLRFKSTAEKDLEIIAPRSQLALYINQTKDKKRPKCRKSAVCSCTPCSRP